MKTLEQSTRETARWITLVALYQAVGVQTSERLILSILQAVPLQTSAAETRAVIEFLCRAGLAETHRSPTGEVTATLTKEGIDLVEYNADCPPGIARPAHKYW
jgi:hypothetical protein